MRMRRWSRVSANDALKRADQLIGMVRCDWPVTPL